MPRYTAEELSAAIKAVKNDNLSVNKASQVHNIPESTLRFKIACNSSEIRARGRQRFLTAAEEQDIYDWLVESADRGKNKMI